MYGAVIGDIVGSVYEWNNINSKEFPFFSKKSCFTDDIVMTVAIAEAMINIRNDLYNKLYLVEPSADFYMQKIVDSMVKWGSKYPKEDYGGNFKSWLFSTDHTPYNSCGNGSAMRVSAVGWLFNSIDTTRWMARLSASVTHNHPEGVKGAETIASAIYLLRNKKNKAYIREYIENTFGYDVHKSYEEIKVSSVKRSELCQDTVPQAIICFLDGKSFEDVIRNAVSIGGDSDTIAAMAGSMAEAYYGIPWHIKTKAKRYIPEEMKQILDKV